MKVRLILMILAVLLTIGSASASHTDYGPSSYGYNYGYNENGYGYNQPFNPFDGFNFGASKDYSNQDYNDFFNGKNGFDQSNQYSNLFNQYNGFSNNYNFFQNFNNNGYLGFFDGYSFTKGPCVTRTVVIDLKGKDPKLQEKICDNIEGTFYKNNAIQNTFNSNTGQNTDMFNQGSLFGNNFNQGSSSQSNENNFGYSNDFNKEYKTIDVNFGKGNIIVYN